MTTRGLDEKDKFIGSSIDRLILSWLLSHDLYIDSSRLRDRDELWRRDAVCRGMCNPYKHMCL